MPQKGQKSVTLPEELVEEASRAAKSRPGFTSTTEFIKEAVREKLAQGTAPSPSPPPAPLPGVPHEAAPETAPSRGRGSSGRPPRRPSKEKASGGDGAAGSEADVPPRTRQPVTDDDAGPARTASTTTTASDAQAPAEAAGAGISMWTCSRCHVEMPLADRWTHKCPVKEVPRAREEQRKIAPDLERLEARLLEQTRAGLPRMLEKGTEQIYLRALVRHVLEEQGVDELDLPADDIVDAFLRKVADRSSVIRRALEVVA